MEFGLKQETIDKINAVFASVPEVDEVIIYGSRAKGNFRNGSDIDLTLKGDKLNHDIISKISWRIDDLLTPYLFDISIFRQISNPALVDHINRVGKLFYEKQAIKSASFK